MGETIDHDQHDIAYYLIMYCLNKNTIKEMTRRDDKLANGGNINTTYQVFKIGIVNTE